MKPFKTGVQFSSWLIRLSLSMLILITYTGILESFNLKTIDFYIALAFCLFALLLLTGGVLGKQSLTVFSGLAIFILSIVTIFIYQPYAFSISMANKLIMGSIGFYFFANGNK